MILSVGIDSVEIQRFADWPSKPTEQLQRIYSPEELAYCMSNPVKAAQRFAVRFAAKEAFYKAIHTILATQQLPLFTVCSKVAVVALENGAVTLQVDWNYFRALQGVALPEKLSTHLSLTHSQLTATAIVIIEHTQS